MSGPGYGHNIHPWLEYFQNRSKAHKLFFLCNSFKFERGHFSELEIIETGGSRKQLILQLLGLRDQLFDILYIHGASNPSHTWLLLHLTKYKISILNLWGNSILDQVQEGKFDIRLLYRLVFGRASYIFLNWYGMKTRFEEYLRSPKIYLYFILLIAAAISSGVKNFLFSFRRKVNTWD